LLKDFDAVTKRLAIKAYVCFCLDEVDNFEGEIDDSVAAKAVLKSL